MLRRVCALLLMLACVLAPALPARGAIEAKANDCCCEKQCTCEPSRACVPPPASPTRAPEVVTATVEQRVVAAKPAARVAFAAFARLLSDFASESATSARLGSADRVAPAAGVALYEAHCSRLI